MKASTLLATLSLLAAGCLWGTGFLFGKIAFEQMTVSENVTFRFIFGSLVLAPVLLKRWRKFCPRDLRLLALAAIIGVPVQFLVQFTGLQWTTVSHASLMVGTLPMIVALSSVILLRERLGRTEWLALLISAAGAAIIALSHSAAGNSPKPSVAGDLLVLLSLVAAAAMILITKRLMTEYDPLEVTAAMIILGTVLLVIWVELTKPPRFHFSLRSWTAVVAQGLLPTACAYLFWNWGLARVPASRAGAFLNVEPLVGAILGFAILRESLGAAVVAGGAMIIGSAVYFSLRPPTRPCALPGVTP
ncbi:MAG: EamA family transporter [Candidatus Acidiferrum sp.]